MSNSAIQYSLENHPEFATYLVVFILVFPFIKWLISLHTDKHRIKLDQIKAAHQMLKSNLEKPSKKQRFLTEQLFESMYKYRFEYEEIVALFNTKSPSKAISLFIKGSEYLKLSQRKKTFTFKEDYTFRKVGKKKIYNVGIKSFMKYFGYAFLALITGIIAYNFFTEKITLPNMPILANYFWGALFVIGFLAFTRKAFEAIERGENINHADKFVEKYGSIK